MLAAASGRLDRSSAEHGEAQLRKAEAQQAAAQGNNVADVRAQLGAGDDVSNPFHIDEPLERAEASASHELPGQSNGVASAEPHIIQRYDAQNSQSVIGDGDIGKRDQVDGGMDLDVAELESAVQLAGARGGLFVARTVCQPCHQARVSRS